QDATKGKMPTQAEVDQCILDFEPDRIRYEGRMQAARQISPILCASALVDLVEKLMGDGVLSAADLSRDGAADYEDLKAAIHSSRI
ncbi:MAG: hypothetical protein ACR2RE_06795, partial [Geminicoccaceae bacterium]